MATPDTMWSTPNVTVATAWRSPPSAPPRRRDERGPRPPLVPGPAGPPGAEDHHALEADVDHAGPLGDEAAEAGQGDGQREDEHGRASRDDSRAGLAAVTPSAEEAQQAERSARAAGRLAAAGRGSGSGPGGAAVTVGPWTVLMPATSCSRFFFFLFSGSGPPSPSGAAAAGRAPRALAPRRARIQPARDLVDDDDRQHDGALDDADTEDGMPACSRGPARLRNANSSAAKAMPTRVAAQQRDGDAGEAEPGGEREAVVVVVAEQLGQADEPGEGPRQEHRPDHHGAGGRRGDGRRGDRPAARSSKPKRVRATTKATTTPTTTARGRKP